MSINLLVHDKDKAAYRELEATEIQTAEVKRRREELIQPYLPSPPKSPSSRPETSPARRATATATSCRFRIKSFLREQLYALTYALVHVLFSVYIHFRIAYNATTITIWSILRYHFCSPDYIRRDVNKLARVPRHVSVILTLDKRGKKRDAVDKLMQEVADVVAWCTSAGIPLLSVYERSGVLKDYMALTHRCVSDKLRHWFGQLHTPELHLHSPHEPVIRPPYLHAPGQSFGTGSKHDHGGGLAVMLISEDDGRESIVDLTKVMAEMAQRGKISAEEVAMEVIDGELSNAVMAEPDLLISFAPYVDLQGYPPWQIRLTEICCVADNQDVRYEVFITALRKYAQATFKLGK